MLYPIRIRFALLAVAVAFPFMIYGACGDSHEGNAVMFRDDFKTLDNWVAWEFDRVDRPSKYEIVEKAGRSVLRMESIGGGSGLIGQEHLRAEEGLSLRWRWRADRLPEVSDPLRRSGDDFAARIYVIFEQDEDEAGWLERWALRNAPFRDEGILPERGIAYALTDHTGLPDHYPNPYSSRVVMFPVTLDESETGEWQDAESNPVADYRKAFADAPPERFRLAIMCDSDDSDSRSLAWLDFIEIRVH